MACGRELATGPARGVLSPRTLALAALGLALLLAAAWWRSRPGRLFVVAPANEWRLSIDGAYAAVNPDGIELRPGVHALTLEPGRPGLAPPEVAAVEIEPARAHVYVASGQAVDLACAAEGRELPFAERLLTCDAIGTCGSCASVSAGPLCRRCGNALEPLAADVRVKAGSPRVDRLVAAVAGQVHDVARAGERVRAGDPLVVLDDRVFQANLDQARGRLLTARVAARLGHREELASAEAEVASCREALARATIRAPADGLLVHTLVDPGTVVPPGAPVADFARERGIEDELALVVANPYAATLELRVKTDRWELGFLIEGPGSRAVACRGGEPVALRALEADGTVVEDVVFPAPSKLSLYTVGGATLYAWREGRATTGRIDPASLVPLGGDVFETLGVPVPKPGAAAAVLARGGSRPASLVPIASAALRTPPSTPPGEFEHPRDLAVAELAPPPELVGKIQRVATDGRAIVALAGGVVRDYASGRALHEAGAPVADCALGGAGVFVLTRQALAGTITAEGRIDARAAVVDPSLRAWASRRDGSIYVYGGSALRGVFRLGARGLERVGSDDVTALGEDEVGLLAARGNTIERLAGSGWTPLIELPAGPPVVGILGLRGVLVFATEEAVSTLRGEGSARLVMPLVSGIGGELAGYRDGVLVHDAASRRVFVLTGPPLGGGR